MATIRSGFPVVTTNTGAAAPYNVLSATFSANAGDELVAFAIGSGLPTVVSRNSADTGAGTLKWFLRCVTRPDYRNTTLSTNGEFQVAVYTAVVPAGGVTERALYTTTTQANEGGGTVSGSKPARLIIVAADDTNGVGAISWRGSTAADVNSNDITTGLAATHPIKPFGNSSLLLCAGRFDNGTAPTAASGCTEVVAPGTVRMPLYSKTGGSPGVATSLGSSQTDASVWALCCVEYLPTTTPAPTKKLLVIGDSGAECVLASMQHGCKAQDDLAPHYALYNQGVWWAHLAQAQARWDAEKADLPHMDYAVLQIGGNDIQDSGYTWTTTFQNIYQAIMDDLEADGTVIIANTGIGPGAGAGLPQAYYDYRDWVTANVPAGSHLYSTQPIADSGTNYTTLLSTYQAADGQHVNGSGNTVWGSDHSSWINSQTAHVYSRPSSDNTDGAWTPSTGTDLYTCIDETVASDTDYIKTDSNSTSNIILSDPGGVGGGVQTFRFRAKGAPNKKLIARLLEGTTTRKTITVDPLPAAFTDYSGSVFDAISNYGNLRVEFECADATTPPTPNASYGSAGGGANGTTSVAVTCPATVNAGDLLVMVFTSGSTGNSTPATPSGWTAPSNNSFASTDGTWGLDAGPRRVTIFTKVAVGNEDGTTVTVTIAGDTNNSCRGNVYRFTKSQALYGWDVVCHGGADSTSGTGFSVTAGAAISFAPGDHLLIAVGQRVDSATQSAQSITASGITFGTRTNRASVAVTTGHDHRHVVDTVPVSSGSGTVAPTWSYTASASVSGGCAFVRIREIPPTADVAQVSFSEFEVPQSSSTPISISDSGTGSESIATVAALSLTDTATGTDTLSITATADLTDTATGTDSMSVSSVTNVSMTDSGSGTDSLSLIAAIPVTDSGTGTDSLSVSQTNSVSMTDSASGTDTLSIAASVSVSDSGTGTDTASISVPVSMSDSATGTDSSSLVAAIPLSDSASGVDSSSLAVQVSATDAATGTESASTVMGATLLDTAAGTDSATIAATVAISDSGAGVDSLTYQYGLSGTDTASGTDSMSITVPASMADTATGTDSMSIAVQVALSDSGTGTDTAIATSGTPISMSDTATGDDSLAVVVSVSAADTASGSDSLSLSVQVSASDSASGTDTLSVQASGQPNLVDTASGTDTLSVAASVSLSDSATGSEALSIAFSASDSASGFDSMVVVNGLSGTDSAVGSDSMSVTVSVSMTDSAVGVETPLIAANIAYADVANGNDVFEVFEPQFIVMTDSASGVDTISVAHLDFIIGNENVVAVKGRRWHTLVDGRDVVFRPNTRWHTSADGE